jgi:hypothetical protein
MGEIDRAFALLDEAVRVRDPQAILLNAFPAFSTLRDDPRFSALLERMGLAEFP